MVVDQETYTKMRLTVRYWLQGRNYHTALRAMDFAMRFHTGKRKDGSPEFSHQIWQVQYLRTLETGLLYPEETLATSFLHDVVEDYPVSPEDITGKFGTLIGNGVERVSKVVDGEYVDDEGFFEEMASDPIASVVKGVDRIHNQKTMIDAFTEKKQIDYMGETEEDIMPMLKMARRNFPEQEHIYENIKHVLVMQMELLNFAHTEMAKLRLVRARDDIAQTGS